MKLIWYGHSCFLLETQQGRLVFDPYEPGYVPGLELPELEAELCLCSHGHGDHNYRAGVKLSGRACGIEVSEFSTFHDDKQGRLRGMNRLHLVEAEGKRLLHLGDLGHALAPELVERLGHIDLLLIPVGGYYTIDAATAKRVAEQLKPDVIVPMHYRGDGFGFAEIAPVEDFARLMDNVRRLDSNILELDGLTGPAACILKCPAHE